MHQTPDFKSIATQVNNGSPLSAETCHELISYWYNCDIENKDTPFCLSFYRFSLLISPFYRHDAMATLDNSYFPVLGEMGVAETEKERIREEFFRVFHFYHTVTSHIAYSFKAGNFFNSHKEDGDMEKLECAIFLMSIIDKPEDCSQYFNFVQSYFGLFSDEHPDAILLACLRTDYRVNLTTINALDFSIALLCAESVRQASERFDWKLTPISVSDFPRELRNKCFVQYLKARRSITFDKLDKDNNRYSQPSTEEVLKEIFFEDTRCYKVMEERSSKFESSSEYGIPDGNDILNIIKLLIHYECDELHISFDKYMQSEEGVKKTKTNSSSSTGTSAGKQVDTEELKKYFKMTYLKATTPTNLFENLVRTISTHSGSDIDYACMALEIYKSTHFNNPPRFRLFSKWYKHFATNIVHVTYHESFKPSKIPQKNILSVWLN